ncbi:MAG: hypothetical protein IJQ59_10645 [Bacteroidaceae bacterium]|nr:hypothetical protein [Bacteroidaceae bacterium]
MITTLLSLLFMGSMLPQEQQQEQDIIPTDTMREVVIFPDSLLPIERITRESLRQRKDIKVPSVSDILNRVSPTLNDKIMHPFAFKQRKHDRRKKKQQQTLEEYSRVKTFDELLREAYEQQMLEDSLLRIRKP